MEKIIMFLAMFFICLVANAQSDKVDEKINQFEYNLSSMQAEQGIIRDDIRKNLSDINDRIQRINSNQLNYKIEKDLLKETYSNNYERINLFITALLGVIGILAYLGIRDISTIKKEYEQELNELRSLKSQFDLKSQEFDNEKYKIDEEIKTIIKENQEQTKKIKFIELKEKMNSLFKDKEFSAALEFANAALEIHPNDPVCLNRKATILLKFHQIPEALQIFKKAVLENPDNIGSKFNYVECLYFSGKIEEAQSIIENHKEQFEKRYNGELMRLFNVLECYHKADVDGLKKHASDIVKHDKLDASEKMVGTWDLTDALIFSYYLKDSECKTVLQNILWYMDSQINGKKLLENLNIT